MILDPLRPLDFATPEIDCEDCNSPARMVLELNPCAHARLFCVPHAQRALAAHVNSDARTCPVCAAPADGRPMLRSVP